jgi:hypothetical protein
MVRRPADCASPLRAGDAHVLVLRHNQFFGLGGTGILPVSDGRDARTTRKINCDGALACVRWRVVAVIFVGRMI